MPTYSVNVAGFELLEQLDGGWQSSDYVAILEQLDVDGATELEADELREMCVLVLQDLEPAEAAEVLLKHKLADVLTKGQITNYGIESQHEKLWEQSADMELHHKMFDVASLLAVVNRMAFPTPDAVRLTLQIECSDADAASVFHESMDRPLLVRMLATGMDADAILKRLFADQLAGADFPEAESIIWVVNSEKLDDKTVKLQVTSSGYWLDAMRETESFSWDPDMLEVRK